MIFQDPQGYKKAKADFLAGKQPVRTIYRKEYFEAMRLDNLVATTSLLGDPIIEEWEDKFKEVITRLKHYDEYYTILDLRKIEIEWCFGIETALGYDSSTWSLVKQHNLIHDDYYSMFWALAAFTMQTLFKMPRTSKSLGERYIINIPLKKSNGSYVWVKQMSMPLSLDSNNNMVRQLNTYTIINRFSGVSLPHTPLMFEANGQRAKDLEKSVFDEFIRLSFFSLTAAEKRVLQTALDLWREKVATQESSKSKVRKDQNITVTHSEIYQRLNPNVSNPSGGAVRVHVDSIRQKVHESFDRGFPATVDIALFLKGLHYFKD